MAKQYKDATPKEKYDSALAKEQADKSYSVTDTLKKLIMPKETAEPVPPTPPAGLPEGKKRGGAIKSKCACGGGKMASGGKVSSASKRADGIAIRGKTRA